MTPRIVYKHYVNGVYQGDLLNVISEFTLSEEINTAASEIKIRLATAFSETDSANNEVLLVDEDSNVIVTEDDEQILLETQITISGFPNLNDTIRAIVYNDDYPNGQTVFIGKVSRWFTKYSDKYIDIFVRSEGDDLNNYFVSVTPTTVALEQIAANSTESVYGIVTTSTYDRVVYIYQTITVSEATEANGVFLRLHRTNPSRAILAAVNLYEGTPSSLGSLITSNLANITNTTAEDVYFQFLNTVTFQPGTTYTLRIVALFATNDSDDSLLVVGYNTLGGYAGGQMFLGKESTGVVSTSYDIYFKFVVNQQAAANQFLSVSPSQMVRDLIDNYNAQGGLVTYDSESIEEASSVVSYTFKFNTYYDAIRKAVELAPINWFYFVDSASSVLYFKSLPETPDTVLTYGINLIDIEIEYDLTGMSNNVYFVGAETNGSNLIVNVNDQDSVAAYGQRLSVSVDNRVTLEPTARTLANRILSDGRTPVFRLKALLSNKDIDATQIRVGQLAGFRNAGNLLNSLNFQIVGKTYTPKTTLLYLSKLPPTQTKRIEDIARNLKQTQTENNPAE